MLKTRSLIAPVILMFATTGWAQSPSFSRSDYATSAAPRGIVAADFNRDGAIDLALANTGRKSVAVLINETAQGRGFVQRYDIVLGGGPFDVAARDVNQDAVLDLIVANADLNTIDLVLGRVDGGFDAAIHIPAEGNPRGLAVADLDSDGNQDIVYTQFYRNSMQILHGDGAGNFAARIPAIPTGAAPQGVAVGIFEGCCRPGIAVANTAASVLSLFRQDDGDRFARKDLPGSFPLNVLATGDFNRDGRLDLAAASTATNGMALYRDMGTGFGIYGTFPTGASPRGIDTADLNNDGRLDLVVANRGGSTVSIYIARADTSGWFSSTIAVAAGTGSRDVALADFNLDGQIDIATANEYGNTATVLTNTLRPPSGPFWQARALPPSGTYNAFVELADFNRNAVIDLVRANGVLLDGTTFVPLTSGGATPRTVLDAAAGDYNGDGSADVVMVTLYHNGAYPQPISAELYYGDGAGRFQYAGSFGSFGWVFDVKAADLDNDGRLDLVIADQNEGAPGGRLYVLLARGSGFGQPIVITSPQAIGLALADVNRDGKMDLLAGQWYDASGVQIYLGDGTGRLSPGQFLGAPDVRAIVHAVDINHDGRLDIVSGGPGPLIVWLGSASGTFGASQSYANDSSVAIVADLTGDGHLDVLTGTSELLRGRGDGSFADPERVNTVFYDARPVDYDRDGRMDVVIVNYWRTMVLLSRATRGQNLPPVADAGPDYSTSYENQFGQDDDCGGGGPSYDPNLDPLTFEWLDASGRIISTEATLCNPILSSGTQTVTLIVRDGHGGESSDTKTITITPFKEAVVLVGTVYDTHGAWQSVSDPTAAAGFRVWHPDAGAAKVNTPLANPTHYVDTWFLADPSQNYKLWVRLKAQNDSWINDSVIVQFDGGAVTNGQSRYAVGTTDGLAINLERCSNCGLSGWGWRDERWGTTLGAAPVLVRFPTGGFHRLRVQTREDGVSIDQIVLSSERYLNAPPGAAKNDNTILQPRPW
jgi:hypothetical protein